MDDSLYNTFSRCPLDLFPLPPPQHLPALNKDSAGLIRPRTQEKWESRFCIKLCKVSKRETMSREYFGNSGREKSHPVKHRQFSLRSHRRPLNSHRGAGRDPEDLKRLSCSPLTFDCFMWGSPTRSLPANQLPSRVHTFLSLPWLLFWSQLESSLKPNLHTLHILNINGDERTSQEPSPPPPELYRCFPLCIVLLKPETLPAKLFLRANVQVPDLNQLRV